MVIIYLCHSRFNAQQGPASSTIPCRACNTTEDMWTRRTDAHSRYNHFSIARSGFCEI